MKDNYYKVLYLLENNLLGRELHMKNRATRLSKLVNEIPSGINFDKYIPPNKIK